MTKNGSKNGPRTEPRPGLRAVAFESGIPDGRLRVGAERHEEAERIRRGEVSRALRKMDLSPEAGAAVEGFTRSLVGRLLRGPISGALARRGDGRA